MIEQKPNTTFDTSPFIHQVPFEGKSIFFVDYSQCADKWQMIQLLEDSAAYYRQSPVRLLSLSDFSDVRGSSEFMNVAKRLNKEVIDDKTEKGAVLGVNGLKKVLLQGYNLIAKNKLVPFETKEEAMRYLVSE